MSSHFDRRQVRRAFGRAATEYEKHAVLQCEVASRLLERLDLLKTPPARLLDVGCGPGHIAALLRKRYRHAQVIALDFALPMLKQARRHSGWWRPYNRICADAGALPFAAGSLDLLFSNLCLQWCEDLTPVFSEFRRVLRPGGLLLISTFGQNTLHELRAAWAKVDAKPHISPFVDVHGIGNALFAAGLRDPVLDVEQFTLTYRDALSLMRDLKAIGASNADPNRSRALTGKARLQQVCAAYEAWRSDGRLPATYEVIYAHAFAPDHGQPQRSDAGEIASFPVEHLRIRRR